MRKLVGPLLMLIAIMSMPSCNKEKNEIEYHWQETWCSNPWNNSSENTVAELKAYVLAYLNSENVDVTEITYLITDEPVLSCEACNCLSGNVVVVKIDPKDEKKILDLGFEKHE
jgi:hypothetical protein